MATITGAVGGGNWSVGGSWVGGSPPGTGDDVLLTAASGSITINTTTCVCRSIDCTGYTGTLTFGASNILSVGDGSGGAVKFVSGMTLTDSGGTLKVVSTSNNGGTGWAITTGGKTLPAFTCDGVSGKWVLQDAFGSGTTVVTVTNGSLFTNGKSVSAGSFSSSTSNTRTVDITNSSITLASQNGWQSSNTTGMTFTSTGSTITCTNGAVATVFGSLAYNAVVIAGFSNAGSMTASGSFVNLTITGAAQKSSQLSINLGAFSVTGTLTVGGNTTQGVNRLVLQSNAVGTQRVITMTGAAVVISGDVNFQDIDFSGTPSWTNSGAKFIGDCGGNGSIITSNRTTPATQTATGTASFTWSTHGWTSRVPLPQDNVVINNAFVAGRTITVDMPQLGANVDFTGGSGSPILALNVNNQQIFGSLTLVAGVAPSGANTFVLAGRTSCTITSAGATFTQQIQLNAPSGTYTLQDAFVCNRSVANSLNITNGTWADNGQTVSLSGASGSLNLTVLGTVTKSGAWSIAATAAATFWSVNASASYTDSGSIALTATSASTRTFAGGGKSYGTFTHTVAGSTGQLTITGSNTFTVAFNFSDVTNARTLQFTAGTTTTFSTSLGFNVQGTSGKLMTVNSSGAAYTLSFTGRAECSFVNITSSTVTQDRAAFAYNSTDGGTNTRWYFVDASKSDTDTGAGADSSVTTLPISDSDTGAVADAQAVTVSVTPAETGSVAEASALSVQSAASDTLQGADAQSLLAQTSSTDTPSGADAQSLAALAANSDAGAVADASVLSAQISDTDTPHGSDAESVSAQISDTDMPHGSDAEAVVVSTSSAETGAVDDAGVAIAHQTDTETAAIADSELLTVLVANSETSSVADTQSLLAAATDLETGSAADTETIITATADTQTGSVDDEASLLAVLGATDSTAADDAAALLAAAAVAETGSAADAASTLAATASTESGSVNELSALTAAIAAVDSSSGLDSATATISILQADSIAGADTAALLAKLAASETAIVVDAGTVAVLLVSADTAAVADLETLVQLWAQTETGTGTDTGIASEAVINAEFLVLFDVTVSGYTFDVLVLSRTFDAVTAGE